MKRSVYVAILAFANIEGVNICWSRQLSFSSVSKKKFHSTASFESTIQATSKIVLFETAEHIFANE